MQGPVGRVQTLEFLNIKVSPYSVKWWNTGEGQRNISTLSLTSTIDGTGWLSPHSDRFTPREETLVHILQEVEWASGRVWRVPTGVEPQTVRPVAIRYTDSELPAAESWRVRNFWVGGRLLLTSAAGPKFMELFEVIKSTCSWALYIGQEDSFTLKVVRTILFTWDYHRFIETGIFPFCTKHFNAYRK